MSQFAKEFSENEIRLQPVTQIPWGTLITVIMPKSKSHQEMLWYIKETHKNAMKAYERSLINPTTTESITKSSNNIEKNLNSNNPFIKNITEEMK